MSCHLELSRFDFGCHTGATFLGDHTRRSQHLLPWLSINEAYWKEIGHSVKEPQKWAYSDYTYISGGLNSFLFNFRAAQT
jgi:hypothetical protein